MMTMMTVIARLWSGQRRRAAAQWKRRWPRSARRMSRVHIRHGVDGRRRGRRTPCRPRHRRRRRRGPKHRSTAQRHSRTSMRIIMNIKTLQNSYEYKKNWQWILKFNDFFSLSFFSTNIIVRNNCIKTKQCTVYSCSLCNCWNLCCCIRLGLCESSFFTAQLLDRAFYRVRKNSTDTGSSYQL